MRKYNSQARPPSYFEFTDEIDGKEELGDVDSQQEQTGLTQPMQKLAITDSSQHCPQQKNR